MSTLEISGKYTSVEYIKITKKLANKIIKSGISEESFTSTFDDLGSSSLYGLTDIDIVSGKTVHSITASKLRPLEEYEHGDCKSFFLIKEEGGACTFKPIRRQYNKIDASSFIEKINGSTYQLLKIVDKDQNTEIELDETSSDPKSISYYLIGPDGSKHQFDISHEEPKKDLQDWNADSILSVKAKDKKSYESFISWFKKVWLPDSPEISLVETTQNNEFSLQGPYGQLQSISSRLEAFGKFTHSMK